MTKRVLIAEDEPHLVESLSFILERCGYEVAAVTDGKDVFDRVVSYRPDVIVLDIMLPNRNGFELLKQFKSDNELTSIPILMLTAKGQEQDRATALSLGAEAFITKPFSNRDVVSCVDGLLKRYTDKS
ncbi:MAG: hypothetical protein DHS20C01_09430 [marine bacterium B5-7]|nr:MAG: hypothetical protein DHS20C01_09430 [marine bacterium B5-7]